MAIASKKNLKILKNFWSRPRLYFLFTRRSRQQDK